MAEFGVRETKVEGIALVMADPNVAGYDVGVIAAR